MTTQPVGAGARPEWTTQDKLRKAREFAGMTTDELAETLEVTRATINNYEGGRRTPKRALCIAWAFACGVDVEWLLPRLDSNQQPFGYPSDYRWHPSQEDSWTHRDDRSPRALRAVTGSTASSRTASARLRPSPATTPSRSSSGRIGTSCVVVDLSARRERPAS